MAELMVPASDYPRRVLSWFHEALQEGEAFLRAQPGYDRIPDVIDAIMGEFNQGSPRPSGLSDITDNRFSKAATDLAAGLTDIKPFWEYRTFNLRFKPQAEMGGKLATAWWLNRGIDIKHSHVVKYALAAGSSYSHIVWSPELGDLDLMAEDPRDVLPVRPASNLSIQDAFGVIIRRERTVNYAKAKWPASAHLIKADREGTLHQGQQRNRISQMMSALNLRSGFLDNLFASISKEPAARIAVPTVDIFTLYVKDDSINRTGGRVMVGEPGTNWSYWVEPGEPLYPRGRAIEVTRTVILRDGPNIYWHGLFPVSKLTLDSWPMTFLGRMILSDALPLQLELNRLMRVVADHNQKVRRPDVIADKNAMPRAALEKIDTAKAGLKLRHNPIAGKGIELIYPQVLDPSIAMTIQDLRNEMEIITGTRDLSQLMKLGQIPTSETVEKMLESMSPAVRMRSREQEAYLREVATMVLSNFFQFYTTAQRVAVLGPSGATFEDFDYDPGTLIPDFIHGDDYDANGLPTEAAKMRGPRPRYERAREFLRMFTYHVAPGSLLAASEITRKLLYVQMARAGWMDIWSLGEILNIPNMGNPPEGANTIPERLAAMQQMGLGMNTSPTGGRKASAQTMPTIGPSGIRESK